MRLSKLRERLLDDEEDEEGHHGCDVDHAEAWHYLPQRRQDRLRNLVQDTHEQIALTHRKPAQHRSEKDRDLKNDHEDVCEINDSRKNRISLRAPSIFRRPLLLRLS
jgi:hypothetical protein